MRLMVDSSARRSARAAPMPSRRAPARFSSGSLLVRTEMKIRLSMPSTTSMVIRAIKATQAAGSEKREIR